MSIEITRGYGSSEFHDDLKAVLMTAGAENMPTVFLFSDSQIVEESFLEDLNNVLGSGEVRCILINKTRNSSTLIGTLATTSI